MLCIADRDRDRYREAPLARRNPNALSAMICVASSMSASGRTITWFFAPPWHCNALAVAAERAYTWRANWGGADETDAPARPVIDQRIDNRAATVFTRLTTPSGNPVMASSSIARRIVSGTRSPTALSTSVLPHAIA